MSKQVPQVLLTKESSVDREFGRRAFGTDPASYHAARPAYPEWVFEVLRERCGLDPKVAVFHFKAVQDADRP